MIPFAMLIDAPYFCAGVVLDENEKVVEAAPIIRYMIGWTKQKIYKYCWKKHWKIQSI